MLIHSVITRVFLCKNVCDADGDATFCGFTCRDAQEPFLQCPHTMTKNVYANQLCFLGGLLLFYGET